MEYDPKDNEVVHLLKKLKESNGTYPPEMFARRRQGYIKQVAQVSAGAGLAMGIRNIAKGGKGAAGMPPVAGKLIEALLVIAIISEAAAVTYFYRDKLIQYYHSITNAPRVEQVASPPVLPSPIAEIATSPSPVSTIPVTASGTGTVTSTAEVTPSPELAAEATNQGSAGGTTTTTGSTAGPNTGNTGSPAVSTQDPNSNNGNHYGQTPLPARTKASGNDGSSTSQDSNTTSTKKKKP